MLEPKSDPKYESEQHMEKALATTLATSATDRTAVYGHVWRADVRKSHKA